ncbi:flagellar motor protein MotB [Halothiobacillus diazotrophicus]|uniref:flagellar motor protein MotB n=1 Tax=Halothiobacillus diazotrophicus TaxID=1860122 RepID=UPI0009EE6614|nr:flagellar motor protein MotB [Halothiobacillus diazotrophicus]
MAEQPDQAKPIIIKKVNKGHHGHHGGAWKIAYADFVTAMMAFFLLMWLLGSVGEVKLKGIADYFTNPLKVTLEGGPSAGASVSLINAGGEDLTRQQGQVHNGTNPTPKPNLDEHKLTEEEARKKIEEADKKRIEDLKKELESLINIDPALKNYKDQIRLDMTRDGLRIQILDQAKRPMFKVGSTHLEPYAAEILNKLAPVINKLPNRLSIIGHTDALPYNGIDRSNWELSADRANAARRELVKDGYDEKKLLRVIGMADALPFIPEDPADPRNRRISIIVMNDTATERVLNPTDFKAVGGSSDTNGQIQLITPNLGIDTQLTPPMNAPTAPVGATGSNAAPTGHDGSATH